VLDDGNVSGWTLDVDLGDASAAADVLCADKDEDPRGRSKVERVRGGANVSTSSVRFQRPGLGEDKRVAWTVE